jgi:hypothetical protein
MALKYGDDFGIFSSVSFCFLSDTNAVVKKEKGDRP